MLTVKLERPHTKACRTKAWFLNTYTPKPHVHRDKSGGKRSTTYRWVQLECSDSKCDALCLVRAIDVEAAVAEALKGT